MKNHTFIFKDRSITTISETLLAKNCDSACFFDSKACQNVHPESIDINKAVLCVRNLSSSSAEVEVEQREKDLFLSCNCGSPSAKLCEHEALSLTAILKREEFTIFFDYSLRTARLKRIAEDYGLENEADLDKYFDLEYSLKKLSIKPKDAGLYSVNTDFGSFDSLLKPSEPGIDKTAISEEKTMGVVLRQHKYYKYLFIELYEADLTQAGKIKNPLKQLSALDFIWKTEDQNEIKFFASLHKFQGHRDSKKTSLDITALKAIFRNPVSYEFYYHDAERSENVTSSSLIQINPAILNDPLSLNIEATDPFFELRGSITIEGIPYSVEHLKLRMGYFIELNNSLYLIGKLEQIELVEYFQKKQGKLLIHNSKYPEFRKTHLKNLEERIQINYPYIRQGNKLQLSQAGFTGDVKKLIYLSDFGEHVMIVPTMQYGEVEIPVRSKRQVFGVDKNGSDFQVIRDEEAEINFIALLIKQHPLFEEQLEDDLQYFYLHKKRFLDEEWFQKAFEDWQNHGISVLGFNQLEGNKLNPEKVNITIRVLSGINWFNAILNLRYGRKKARLKQVFKAIRNKSKYVQLDDGTYGILPADWIEKFSAYFQAGQIADDETLIIPKTNFTAVDELFEQEMLDQEVKQELKTIKKKLSDFSSIREIETPEDLKGTLRPYQKQGLNWLNFLDEFNFGGCLADDMGLGKSVQIIAFILSQRSKPVQNTNIIVAPASLIFNWQAELKKFAPSIKVYTIYGSSRVKNIAKFGHYEVILTSYGTLLSDINHLKEFEFNYVFLDESQNIKNPDSQRHKAVRLLKSRNKIAITGTPVENSTFDLFGQLSFACPGLLGTKQYFKDIYAVPIDKFKNSKRALELHNRVKPFILRRTKQQVASELPEKTEMILYCEMQAQQRKIYDAYEKEFREYICVTTNDEIKKSPMNVLKGLTKLRQICNSPILLEGETLKGEESAKIDMLMQQIEEKATEHKILVFSQFVGMLDLIKPELKKRKIRFSYLSGSTRNREAVVNEFQNDPEVRVFLISLKAGGTGLNLTEADYVYLVDPWWNPAVENQAIDRAHRIGQDKKVIAVRLICTGTVEEKILQLQQSKKELVQDLIKANAAFINSLNQEVLLDLLQ